MLETVKNTCLPSSLVNRMPTVWTLRSTPGGEGTTGACLDGGQSVSKHVIRQDCKGLIEMHEGVKQTGSPNFEIAKIPMNSNWNIDYMTRHLACYHDQMVITLCKYGWPIGITDSENLERQSVRNHSGGHKFPDQMNDYIARELVEGTLLGPFKTNLFQSPMVVSPLNTAEKRYSDEQQVIMDLSFPPGGSVNDKIPKDS